MVFQAAAGRNLRIDPSKYPRKYSKYDVRQWALIVNQKEIKSQS